MARRFKYYGHAVVFGTIEYVLTKRGESINILARLRAIPVRLPSTRCAARPV